MRRGLLVLAIVAAAGLVVGIAVADSPSTGTVSVCAAATVPAQTLAVNGADVATVPAASDTECSTTTYTVPTVTDVSTQTVTQTVTTAAATTTAPATTTAATTTQVTTTAPSAAAVSVSPSGSDTACARGGSPCLTFEKAYTLAQCGDTVTVAGGIYPGQTLTGAKVCTSSQVTFAAQGQVTLTGQLDIAASYVTFSGPFNLAQTYAIEQGTSWVSMLGVSTPYAFVMGSHIVLKGGQIGPNNTCNTGWEDGLQIWDNGSVSATYVTVDGVTIHDITDNGNQCAGTPHSGVHVDCIQMLGASNITIENSTFYNCATSDIIGRPYTTPMHDILVENNMFGHVVTAGASINIGNSSDTCSNVVVEYNTVQPGNAWPSLICGHSGSTGNIARGNIFPGYYQQAGFQSSYNITQQTSAVGTGSKECLPVFNPASSNVGDFHLAATDTCARGAGDPLNFPATDFDGDVRVSPPSAGADQG